ncbi:MAG: hypothetical protein WCD76_22435, partial [Pyrinomonadaceae bacterium]
MSDQLVTLNVRAAWKRVPLIVIAAAALLGAWYGVRWLVGATMAEYAQDFETAESAARLAPRDPETRLKLARLHRVSFEPEELPLALEQYEQAAALDPNNWMVWLEMGRARGSSGDME